MENNYNTIYNIYYDIINYDNYIININYQNQSSSNNQSENIINTCSQPENIINNHSQTEKIIDT